MPAASRETALHKRPCVSFVQMSMCTWDHWPEEAKRFFRTEAPQEIRRIMQRRAPGTGRTNEELTRFRDKGLLELLKYHQLI